MRNFFLTGVSTTALILGVATAHGEHHADEAHGGVWSNTYISLFGGYSTGFDSGFVIDDYNYYANFKDGFTVGGAFGTYLTPSVRGEVELSYQRYATDTYDYRGIDDLDPANGHVDSINLFLNVWKDIDVGTSFTPYVGGGIGMAIGSMSVDWNGGELSEGTNIGFATQLGAGARMDVSDRVKLDVGYRLRSIYSLLGVDEDASDISIVNYFSHSVHAGFTYMLGNDYDGMDNMGAGEPDVYYTLFAGVALPQDSVFDALTYAYEANNKVGGSAGAAIGTSLMPGLRGEIEAAYTYFAHDNYTDSANDTPQHLSGSTGLYTLTANIWKDIPVGNYTTYVGGGIGFGLADTNGKSFLITGTDFDGTGLGMALQFGAGVRKTISSDVAVDIGYRAKGVFGAISEGVGSSWHTKGSFLSHMLQIGFTYGNGMFELPEAEELASQGHYVTLFGGAALHEGAGAIYNSYTYEMNYDTGFTLGAAVGTQISDSMRGELELSYIRSKICGSRFEPHEVKCAYDDWKGTQETVNLLANIWKDFDVGMISPYVGGGVGLALFLPDIGDWVDREVAMAAQIGGGVRYDIMDDLTFDLGYRFKGVFDPLVSGHTDSTATDSHGVYTYYTHAVTGGLTWGF